MKITGINESQLHYITSKVLLSTPINISDAAFHKVFHGRCFTYVLAISQEICSTIVFLEGTKTNLHRARKVCLKMLKSTKLTFQQAFPPWW